MESAVVSSPDAVRGEVSCIYYQCYYQPPSFLLLLFFFFFLLCEDILLWSLQWSEVLMQCMERSAVFIISVMTHPFVVVVVVVCFVLWRHFVMESAVVRSPDAVHGEVCCIYYQCYAPSLPPHPLLFLCVSFLFCFVMTFCYGATVFSWREVTLFSLSVLKHLSDLAWIWHIFKEITDTFVYRPPSHDRNCNTSFLFETGEIWKCFMMMTSFERYTSYQVY